MNTDPKSVDDAIAVAVAYHSGSGHTARQARAVADGAAGVARTTVRLLDVGTRDSEFWSTLQEADAIIFGAPTYMGSASAVFKAFAEETSRPWGDGLRWKDKVAAGFTNSQNIHGDKLNTLVSLAILAAQHGMHWVSLGLYPGWNTTRGSAADLNRLGSFLGAMAQSNGDEAPETAPPASDLATAAELGRRVATVTHQIARGRILTEASHNGQAAKPRHGEPGANGDQAGNGGRDALPEEVGRAGQQAPPGERP